jgi:hypothetical protein
MKVSIVAAVAAITFASTAYASGGNSDRAKAMADVLSGTPGIGGAAPGVSGNDPALGIGGRSESGWGNTGSGALSPGGSITEGAKQQGGN